MKKSFFVVFCIFIFQPLIISILLLMVLVSPLFLIYKIYSVRMDYKLEIMEINSNVKKKKEKPVNDSPLGSLFNMAIKNVKLN